MLYYDGPDVYINNM